MGSELGILGLYGLVMVVTIIIQAQARMVQVGLPKQLSSRDDMPPATGVAGRLDRAQANAVVAMALFAPAVLILAVKGVSSGSTVMAAQAFLVARILYVPAYAFGWNGIRSLLWGVGFVGTAWLYLAGLAG